MRAALVRVYIQAGQLAAAERHIAVLTETPAVSAHDRELSAALLECARGEWVEAGERLRRIVAEDAGNYAVRP